MSLAFFYCASAAVACAIYYGVELSHQESSFHKSVVKTASTAILMVSSALLGTPILLTLSFAVGAIGDFLISRQHEEGFLASLGFFAAVQLIIVCLFVQHSDGVLVLFGVFWRPLLVLAIFTTAVWVVWKMWPNLSNLRWPVVAYTSTVALMGSVALTLPTSWPLQIAQVAAGLFILSNVLIALKEFVIADDHPWMRRVGLITWFSYFSGLVLLLAAFM